MQTITRGQLHEEVNAAEASAVTSSPVHYSSGIQEVAGMVRKVIGRVTQVHVGARLPDPLCSCLVDQAGGFDKIDRVPGGAIGAFAVHLDRRLRDHLPRTFVTSRPGLSDLRVVD